MAFSSRSLVRVAQIVQGNANGTASTTILSKWFYATADAFAAVATAGYFNDARGSLKVGDMIEVSCAANKGGLYTVSASPATGNVTVVASVLA